MVFHYLKARVVPSLFCRRLTNCHATQIQLTKILSLISTILFRITRIDQPCRNIIHIQTLILEVPVGPCCASLNSVYCLNSTRIIIPCCYVLLSDSITVLATDDIQITVRSFAGSPVYEKYSGVQLGETCSLRHISRIVFVRNAIGLNIVRVSFFCDHIRTKQFEHIPSCGLRF